MNLEDIQKLALEWQEEKQKETQRKLQAEAVAQDSAVKINMYEGGLQFAGMLVKQFEQTGVVQLDTKASTKKKES